MGQDDLFQKWRIWDLPGPHKHFFQKKILGSKSRDTESYGLRNIYPNRTFIFSFCTQSHMLACYFLINHVFFININLFLCDIICQDACCTTAGLVMPSTRLTRNLAPGRSSETKQLCSPACLQLCAGSLLYTQSPNNYLRLMIMKESEQLSRINNYVGVQNNYQQL